MSSRSSTGRRFSQALPARVKASGGGSGKRRTVMGGLSSLKKKYSLSAQRNAGGMSRLSRPSVAGSSRRMSAASREGVTKDTRPLSNPQYKSKSIQSLLDFLISSGYSRPLTKKNLTSPTSKEFTRIFEFMYSLVMPNYTCNKVEEEFPMIMKQLGYPFQITKSAMFSMASLHGWPSILGALTWLREIIQYGQAFDVIKLLFPESEPGNSDVVQEEELLFAHAKKAYNAYLCGMDDEAENIKQDYLRKIFSDGADEDDEDLEKEIEEMRETVQLLEKENSPLEEAQGQLKSLMADKQKLVAYFDEQQTLLGRLQVERDELDRHLQELGLQDLPSSFQSTPTPEQIQQAQLIQAQLAKEKENEEMKCADIEMRLAKTRGKIETSCSEYNESAQSILFEVHRDKKLIDEYLINPSTSKENIRVKIIPNLSRLRVRYKDMAREKSNEVFDLQQTVDHLQEQIALDRDHEKDLENKIKKMDEELETMIKMKNLKMKQLETEVEQSEQRLKELSEERYLSNEQQIKARDEEKRVYAAERKAWKEEESNACQKCQRMTREILEHKSRIDKTLADAAKKAEENRNAIRSDVHELLQKRNKSGN